MEHTTEALAAPTESLWVTAPTAMPNAMMYRTESPQQVSTVRRLWFVDTMQLREVGNVAV